LAVAADAALRALDDLEAMMADEPAPIADPAPTPAPAPVGDPPAPAAAAPAAEAKAAEATEAAAREAEKQLLLKAPEPVDYAKALAEAKMPDGMTLDPAAAKIGTDLFAKHKISAEAAKDLVSLYAQQQKAGADGNAKAFADQVTGWKAAAEKSTTAEERGSAKEAALKVFGPEELKVFEAFGITNRAGFIKALAKIGKAIKDDTFVPGNAGAHQRGSRCSRSLPKQQHEPVGANHGNRTSYHLLYAGRLGEAAGPDGSIAPWPSCSAR
jgi:hypothetical protein